jgi:hypothetical protein
VRNIEKIFESINNIKKIPKNINSYTSIYSDADTRTGNIEFSKKYIIPAKYTDRKIITNIKNSARPQSPSKRRKLIHL